ncbi:hypothetical protein [Promicromonospora sp. NPDC050249]|uniref:hypothetical protein n=1 Tax=Promicromonospora sp. NPDC050249 TaxID=3154743 RepID=UPI0033F384A7
MKEQSDILVKLIHDAAGQVGPLDGIDGEAMARRAIRHERTRRGVIGGAVAIVLAVLGTALWVAERPALPAGLPWTRDAAEVRSDELVFELPEGYEEFTTTGDPMWGLDPVIPNESEAMEGQNAYAPSWIATAPAEDAPLVGELVGNPVTDVDVPGAVSARWSWYSADDVSLPGYWERKPGDGDFVGELDVELHTGTVVRLTMSLTDDESPQDTFERLVRTVEVDGEVVAPDGPPATIQEDLPPIETTDAPESWAGAEFHGLTYAAPGDWTAVDGEGAEHPADTLLLRRPDGKAELQLAVADRLENFESGGALDLPGLYRFELADADVSIVRTERFDGEYRAYIEVRRADGRSYMVNLSGYPGAGDLEDDLAALLGSLGFTEESKEGATAYDKLDSADPLLQDPPSDWRPETFEGIRLKLPPELKSDEGTWGIWTSDSDDTWEELLITPWDMEAYDQPLGLDENGYRYEPPGTARGVATVGTSTDTGEPLFLGRSAFYLTPDGRNAFEVRYEGSGATEERWWQILASLDATDLTSP